jgi:hypothetical protein
MKAEALAAPPAPPHAPEPATEAATPTDAAPAMVSGMPGAGAPGAEPSAATAAVTVAGAPTQEMLDIEANASLEVPKVRHAVRALHELAARVGGVVTNERIDASSNYGSAEVTLRVPSRAAQGVFQELDRLGKVREQTVSARDIGKEYFDAKLRLSSLETTLHRYEEILTHASKVEEILRIEQELSRLRAEIEQVKGNLRWLSDRAARATLHVTLREHVPEIAVSVEPEAKFFPGLRLPALIDFGKRKEQGYAGGGLSLSFSRYLSVDLDILKRPGSEERGPDAILATVGGEIYSELLGGGERRFLNPYLGWRAGYLRSNDANQALVGATLGLELYKNRSFTVDAEACNYLAFFGEPGAHYLLSPALAARVAF